MVARAGADSSHNLILCDEVMSSEDMVLFRVMTLRVVRSTKLYALLSGVYAWMGYQIRIPCVVITAFFSFFF